MRDWEALVAQRFAGVALEPEEKAEVIAELAAHLEESCEAMRRQGIEEEEAVRRALAEAGDWRALQRRVFAAKGREYLMETRARQLWVPGFLTLILSMVFLAVVRGLGFQPRVVSGGPMTMLFYTPWLLSLPLLGALGAYISIRAGASRRTALLVSAFPALALAGAFLVMSPIGMAIERFTGNDLAFRVVAATLLKDTVGWILLPGVALLVGGVLVSFLLNPRSPSQQSAIG